MIHPQATFSDAPQSSAFAELGPSIPPMGEMRRVAVEAHQLVLILLDTTVAGPGGNPSRAAKTLDRLRALVGPNEQIGD